MQIPPTLPLSTATTTTTTTTSAPTEAKPETTDDSKKVPGVIRNLQNGKYKGVADVRLRIVHADKIAALQADTFKTQISDAATTLTSALQPLVKELTTESVTEPVAEPAADSDEPVVDESNVDNGAASDPLEAFRASIADIVATTKAAIGLNVADFSAAVRDAFQVLLTDLNIAPAANTNDTEPAPESEADDTIDVETEAPRDYATELTAAFDAALASLIDSATAAGALPPLSEPSGNGAAYEKFLALYNDLQNTDEPNAVDDPAGSDVGDVEADIDTALDIQA